MTDDKEFEDKHAEGWYPFEPINEASAWAENFINTVQHVELNAATSNAEDIVRNLRFMAAAAGYEAGAEAARPKWIKCSERLPKKGEWVLRYSPTRGPETDCIKFILPDGIPAWWGDYVYNCEDATHWMPLPSEPPSEKEEVSK